MFKTQQKISRFISSSGRIILFTYLCLHTVTTLAAPLPLTSSSLAISAKKGWFHSKAGFSIHAADSDWVQMTPPKSQEFIETIYRSTKDENIQAALTVRLDPLKEITPLQTYAKKWMKDYPRFGFDVVTAKSVRVGRQVGFLLDLIHREQNKQIRQLLFVKNKQAVSLTCRDDQKSFSKTLKTCNDIIRTFEW